MKQCPVCGREVVSKRKDAVFCKDSACRKKAHQVRKEQAAQLPLQASANKASVVVTFPDGSRWLLELSPLHATDPAQLPTLTQVIATAPQNSSGSTPPAQPLLPAPEIRSEQIPQAAPQKGLRTVELFFTDHSGRRVPFRDAVLRRFDGSWSLRRSARARLGVSPQEGYGLGGVPGRWRELFPTRSPTEFGLDGDVGVLYADEDDARTYAAGAAQLKQILGAGWRAQLSAAAEGRETQGS